MKQLKRIISLCLVVALLAVYAPSIAQAEETTTVASGACGDNLTWELTEDGTLTISGEGEMSAYWSYDDIPWYDYNEDILKVVIENGVTSISDYAFWGYTNLQSAVIGDNVATIGYSAFIDCTSLADLAIGKGVTEIGAYAFAGCESLTELTIPDTITGIKSGTFQKCTSLEYLSIPDSVRSIGSLSFYGCTGLKSLNIGDGVTYIDGSAFEGCTSLTDLSLGNNLSKISSDAFADCNNLTTVTIPDSVTSIGYRAFQGCTNLTTVIIGDGLNSMGWWVFNDTNLTKILVSDDNPYLSNDEYGALLNQDKTELILVPGKLSTYTVPDGVTTIDRAFYGDTTTVMIPASVTDINDYAFSDVEGLSGIWVDEDNTYYSSDEYGVLFNKEKTELIKVPTLSINGAYAIPDSVTIIDSASFSGCIGLNSVTIPAGVTSIDYGTFNNCTSLVNVIIPDSVTEIGGSTFEGCTSLTNIAIPNSVTEIGAGAFEDCTNLTNITIPRSVTYIEGGRTFTGCSSLKGIWVDEGNENYSSDDYGVLFNKDKTELLESPGGINGSYIIPDSVTSIGWYAFCDCTDLTSITIPGSVTNLDYYTFQNCSDLVEITFLGDAPRFGYYIDDHIFDGVIATAYYPAGNDTWTKWVMQDYGGTITWVAYGYTYDILEDENFTVTEGADSASICIDADPESFISVSVDGKVVAAENYTVTEGSTIVTFNGEYLSTLSNGTHTVNITFTERVITAELTITAVFGDVDGDGEISDWDAIILNRYLAGWDVTITQSAADVDGDGEVSDWDAIVLERYLAGWNITIG